MDEIRRALLGDKAAQDALTDEAVQMVMERMEAMHD